MKYRSAVAIFVTIFIHATTAAEIPDAVCASVEPCARKGCGFSGISAQECKNRGCCYANDFLKDVFCFHPPSVIRPCLSSPCQNGGTCFESTYAYICVCVTGFVGTNCQTNVNECASSPCLNGGTCLDGVNRYLCKCPEGMTGVNCQTGIRTDGWTLSVIGCRCYWDPQRTDCACCVPGGCQCDSSNHHQCVKCHDSPACNKPFAGRGWTLRPVGCTCYWDRTRTDCACCASGGCQCGHTSRHQCVKCGDGSKCGKRYVSDWWTEYAIGNTCYWDTRRSDCPWCASGGCQCGQAHQYECVRCKDGASCGKEIH